MKPELEKRPIQVSQGDTPSTLREASVMCKTNGGLWKPLKTFFHQPQWAAAINLWTLVHTVVSKLGEKLCCARFLLHGYGLFIHLQAWFPNKQQVPHCVFAQVFLVLMSWTDKEWLYLSLSRTITLLLPRGFVLHLVRVSLQLHDLDKD